MDYRRKDMLAEAQVEMKMIVPKRKIGRFPQSLCLNVLKMKMKSSRQLLDLA